MQTLVPPEKSWVGHAAWSPDSRRLAVGFGNGTTNSLVYVWDTDSGELLQTLDTVGKFIQSIAWHPTIPDLIAVSQNANLPMEFWDVAKGNRVDSRTKWRTWTFDALCWSPNGKQLAIAGWRPQIIDWKSRTVIKILSEQHTDNATNVCFSRDGSQLVTVADLSLIHI